MSTQYAVKYELSNTHTGRTRDTLAAAAKDAEDCQKSANAGLGDSQGIGLVAIEADGWRTLTEEEMDAWSAMCD